MIYPKFLKEKDCIGIPAPSAGAGDEIRQNRMLNAKKNLEALGYQLFLSDNLLSCDKGRSASAKERAEEINEMFSNPNIKMILCACGGDFLVEILPYVQFDLLKENLKLVAGFSDPTGLLYPITTKYDIATVYGNNFSSFGAEKWNQSEKDFLKTVRGNQLEVHSYDFYEEEHLEKMTGLEPDNLTEKVYWKTLKEEPACVQGRMIGGCLDIIAELAGTPYDGIKEFQERYKNDGIIWYFDNCELSMEETIRTLWKINELGYFQYTKGVLFGRFGVNNTSCYDYDVKSCLQDSVLSQYDFPVVYDADISHKPPCMPIINGAIAKVKVKDGKGTILFELK